MIDMTGPGGKEGCSRFNCLNKAVSEYVYNVAHPYQKVYDVVYRYCKDHDHVIDPVVYPTHTLKEHKAL